MSAMGDGNFNANRAVTQKKNAPRGKVNLNLDILRSINRPSCGHILVDSVRTRTLHFTWLEL